MKNKIAILVLAIIFFTVAIGISQKINWVCSTEQDKWIKKDSLTLNEIVNATQFDIEVLTDQKQQTIDGWGGCFLNELGWQALLTIPVKERDKVIKEFFDPNEGLRKYNICRMPIGANDYSFTWYSLNETDGDFKMKNFTIERDKSIIIPYIKAAMKYRPDLKIWASPWSPPTWMKTNKHYANKPNSYNDLTEANAIKSGDQFNTKKYLLAYALYLAKFVTAYQNQGINVYAIHFQNEPYTYNQWPNCSWTAKSMRDFISMYLGPRFVNDKISSQIWFSSINNGNIAVFDTVLSQPEVRKYISGVGFQYEGKDAVAEVAKKYPELNLMQTETPCGNGSFDWKAAESTFGTIKSYLDKGVKSYMYWNMILDNTGESTWGWRQNAQVTIDKITKKVNYTPEFYIFKHISYFVTPGSVKLSTKGQNNHVLAFVTPENKIIIVALNTSNTPTNLKIKVGSKSLEITLPQKSFNTLSM